MQNARKRENVQNVESRVFVTIFSNENKYLPNFFNSIEKKIGSCIVISTRDNRFLDTLTVTRNS